MLDGKLKLVKVKLGKLKLLIIVKKKMKRKLIELKLWEVLCL